MNKLFDDSVDATDLAEESLSSRRLFCDILNYARQPGVPGAWSGSAFREHPCGIKIQTIKMTNRWHVDNHCEIDITDGDGWSDDYCTESAAYGNPHPKPINGIAIRVWDNGKWSSDDFENRLKPKVLEILVMAINKIRKEDAARNEAKKKKAEKARQESIDRQESALNKIAIN